MPPLKPSSKSECVKVVIRCRPLNSKEKEQGHERIVDMDSKRGHVAVRNPKPGHGETAKEFTFDAVYDWDSKQKDLYEETFRDLVQSVLDGFNGTIFAYGQTGTGKTFTMQGVKNDPELRGVIPNSFEHIFQHISRSHDQQYLVRASYLEIYMEEIRDLLSKDQTKRLELKERPDTGVYVKDLSSFVTKSGKEIEHVMNVGNQNRSVGATNMNEHSSRSHAIFIITIECSEEGTDGENHIRVGKLNLVDLAGSERQAKTGAAGDRLKEATKINLSLSALGNVISALVDGKSSHIPYRDSKLTRLLQDSLGGNAKTVMVANIGPASYNFDETVTTLRYANRAKNIKNKPKINEDPKDALLREFQEEIARLKAALGGKGGGGSAGKKKKKKKKMKRNENGELVEASGSEEEDEASAEQYEAEQREKLEQERAAIMNDSTLIAEEREKLLGETQEKEEKLKKEMEAKEALTAKIKAMEGKLLCGGKNIVDHTNEQQKVLEAKRHQIAEQKRHEREMQQKLEEQEEAGINMQDTYTSLQQEVEIKTKKLKKLFSKLQATKQEIQDLQEEHVRERQELEGTQNELTRELKLKMLIIENFIPHEEKNKLMNRAYFDEEEDTWKLQALTKHGTEQMAKRPVSAVGNRRPTSEFARMQASMGGNPRYKAENIMTLGLLDSVSTVQFTGCLQNYCPAGLLMYDPEIEVFCNDRTTVYMIDAEPFNKKGENILQLELDMPNRTTKDYEGPSVAPRVQAALDAALQDEDDIDIDGSPAVFSSKRKEKGRKQPAAKSRAKQDSRQMYPTARGLVK